MVENMDLHVGRLIDHLKKIGEYENTIFVVFGDNGAEGTDLFKMIAGTPGTRDYLFAAIDLVADPSQRLGRPRLVRRLRPDVGAGLDDAFQPVQGLDRRGRHPQCADRQRPGRQAAQGQHQPRPDARGRPHADDARSRGHHLSEDPGGPRAAAADGQVLGPRCWPGRPSRRAPTQDYLAWEVFGNRALRQGDWKLRWQIQADRQGRLGAVRPRDRSCRAQGSRRRATRQGQGDGRAVGRLRTQRTTSCCRTARSSRRWTTSCRRGCRTTRATRR